MSDASIPDNRAPIHLRNWLLASGDPLRDLSLFAGGFSQQHEGSHTQATTEPPARTAHLVTRSAAQRELLARCLRALDLAVADTTEQPDLVLLDLTAPDALTHCQALRECDPDLPIIALVALVTDHLAAGKAAPDRSDPDYHRPGQ